MWREVTVSRSLTSTRHTGPDRRVFNHLTRHRPVEQLANGCQDAISAVDAGAILDVIKQSGDIGPSDVGDESISPSRQHIEPKDGLRVAPTLVLLAVPFDKINDDVGKSACFGVISGELRLAFFFSGSMPAWHLSSIACDHFRASSNSQSARHEDR